MATHRTTDPELLGYLVEKYGNFMSFPGSSQSRV